MSRALGITLPAVGLLLAGHVQVLAAEDRPGQSRHILDSRTEYLGPGREEPDPPGLAEVRIGWFGPQDPADGLGRNLWRGAALAIEEANRAGGYHGLPFRLVARWAADPWADGSRQVAELIYREQVWAVLGSVDGATTHIAEQLATKARVPLVAPICSDRQLTQTNVAWIFRCAPDDLQQARVLAGMLADVGPAALAVVSATDHDSRVGTEVLIRNALAPAGIVPQWHLHIEVKQEDYAPQVDRLREYGADVIVLWAPPASSARFVRQLRELGGSQRVLGPAALAGDDFLRAAGPAAEGVMTVLTWDPPSGITSTDTPVPVPASRPATTPTQFAHAYRSRFGEAPDHVAAYGYDSAKLLVEAIRRSGLNRVRIREALAGSSGYMGATGPFHWDNGGGNIRAPRKAVIRSGRIRPLDDPP